MLFTSYCQMQRISLQTVRKIHIRYAMYFSAILSNYNGMTAYICRRFLPTTAFLVYSFKFRSAFSHGQLSQHLLPSALSSSFHPFPLSSSSPFPAFTPSIFLPENLKFGICGHPASSAATETRCLRFLVKFVVHRADCIKAAMNYRC